MLSCSSRRSKYIYGQLVLFLSLRYSVSVSGLAVCDPLVGVTAAATGAVCATPLPLISYRQNWSAEFPPSTEASEGVISLALPDAASVRLRQLSLAEPGWCEELELLLDKHLSRAYMGICHLSS